MFLESRRSGISSGDKDDRERMIPKEPPTFRWQVA
jgi:hypothetical protein